MMKIFVVLGLVGLSACATTTTDTDVDLQQKFIGWVQRFNKSIAVEDIFTRFNTFKANHAAIMAHNLQSNGSSFSMALNEFADLTAEEMRATYLGLQARSNTNLGTPHVAPWNYEPQESVDWREKNAVTPVKHQASCGSCWAFSATGAVEAATAINSGAAPVPLSEQQLVDCDSNNLGCEGGLMETAFEFISQSGGLCASDAYPYTARNGQCATSCERVATISSYKTVWPSTKALESAVDLGPVSVAIQASRLPFIFYNGGILSGWCGQNLDHGVLLVGYGTEGGQDYWIVKNSWGWWWGERGYIRIAKGEGSNKCGILSQASFPIV